MEPTRKQVCDTMTAAHEAITILNLTGISLCAADEQRTEYEKTVFALRRLVDSIGQDYLSRNNK